MNAQTLDRPVAPMTTSAGGPEATLAFHDCTVGMLDRMSQEGLDELEFGTIAFDPNGTVVRYNAFESRAAGLAPARVIGQPLFTVVAPCMNNYLVAQRFEDASAATAPLDATIDYVLTLRMKPVKVKLRLLADAGREVRYVLVQRSV